MSTTSDPRTRRALGIAMAVIAATPSIGCTDSHSMPGDDASTPVDAASPADEDASEPVAMADSGPTTFDAGVDGEVPHDAGAEHDADLDAYYYPDGIRG